MGLSIPKLSKGHRTAVSARLRELPLDERRQLLAHARRAAFGDWRPYVPLAVGSVAGIVGVFLATAPKLSVTPYGFVVVWALFTVGFAELVRADLLRDRLVLRTLAAGFPTLCPTCGYDRRATPARCPACGTESPVAPSAPADTPANRG